MPKRITSIKEVAKLAECSIATVSNTLNNKGRISKEVRERILEICQKHGYSPNSAGRNLRRQQNETIGLLFYPNCGAIFRNIFYAEIMEALEAETTGKGYDLLLAGFENSGSQDSMPRFVQQGKVDGIVMLGRFPRADVKRISDYGVPLLQLDNFRSQIKVDYVTSDGFTGSKEIVDELVKLRHRRIVFMAYSHEDTNADQREAGFQAAAEAHQLPKTLSTSIRDFEDTQTAYSRLKKLLQSKRPPTAVVAVNDTLAIELQQCLQQDGYSIPEDISIVGFDDDDICQKATPKMSSVRVDKKLLGKTGAQMIIDRINNPQNATKSVHMPVEVVLRDSVGTPSS
jgi:LacI family transcriptional regulator